MEKQSNIGRAIIGVVLILIGIAFVGRTFDLFPHRIFHHLFSWQMILIILGVIFISSDHNKTTGWILLVLGVVFLIPDFIHISYPVRHLFWPSILILIGVFILVRSFSSHQPAKTLPGTDYIDDLAIFGGGDKVITSENFKGGRITAIFGGSKIDLTHSKLAAGQNSIDVFCMFGGSNLIVPENWNIKVDVVSIFGGFSDKRHKKPEPVDVGKELIVKGFAIFGGGEIKY
ncbi:MAG: hypothetical protein A2X13_01040 [Bacteroidetes bacterium GWC2_33_15]|nr:MAG: hypothetical protein A2X10_00135 [Bacteroidetes bacterium GWA2_33_15]OFX49947.1 MAG: hypothetical protein A2X13_01040 [Bacteroidetes bacterium GWC2_33_15]OFX64205.1 MAG: hypothetical protein A2X15_15120 [Bacteroidetes bacterium GWB2_32_14]OFX69617.1 MAG: hypothetical protein A2X14_15420 [Bacteroidetes bacterium GWD2_33_33]HAN19500.1 hypothetical protein [Bacteroidales bacterium]